MTLPSDQGKAMNSAGGIKKGELYAVNDRVDAKSLIKSSHTSELVIALCGPIGSPLHKVAAAFEACLKKDFGYDPCVILRLSELIEQHEGLVSDSRAFFELRN
jgi:hypothetical protein